ncbi:hypothetical protein BJF79_03810 [Actinomadura sp. CNU-125]|uniref:hypothetical protein n=1 Tax=Actinomadura sp. CNU-125 TaxID=1904961 RepID=UPI00095DF5DB|nr:hypothetical protein [Actinomadura sp. CNU-125]OLT13035.1 hypothetical protein BJF79_03810 [Actinomadura sp. CNU-125]
MTEPRHITVSLTVRTTDLTPDEVRLRILAAVGDQFEINHASAYDLNSIPDEPEIQLVVCPVRGLLGAYVGDEGRADEHAKREGAAWAGFTVGGDYRGEVTA